MTPEFAYFLKVNVAFVLFYAFYRLLFYKDTFFKLRRASLLCFLWFGVALSIVEYSGMGEGTGADDGGDTDLLGYVAGDDSNPRGRC